MQTQNYWLIGIGAVAVLVLAFVLFGSSVNTDDARDEEAQETDAQNTSADGTGGSQDIDPTTVESVVRTHPDAQRFAQLATSVSVGADLSGSGPFTVFIPTDEAFASVEADTLTRLLAEERVRLVQSHIVEGRAVDITAAQGGSITTLSGDELNYDTRTEDGSVIVSGAFVIQTIPAGNGTVYLVNSVLLPAVQSE